MAFDIPRMRLQNQHIARPRFRSPGELVAHMGAVQAQEYWGGKWGLGLRLLGGTDAAIERAIEEREIVRTWPMRGTLHFVSPADVRWMLRLLTPRVVRLAAGRHRQLELDEEAFSRARKIVVDALARDGAVTRMELTRLLREHGIETKDARGLHIFGHLAQEGTIIFGPRHGKQPTFVLLEEWVPPAPVLEGDEALAELAMRYFSSHGPATAADFAWWSGLTLREVRTGIECASGSLSESDGYWMAQVMRARKSASPVAWLLPPYDEYAVGYRDRSSIVPTDLAKAAASGGIFSPIVVIDGQVAGEWKRTQEKEGVTMSVSPFREFSGEEWDAVNAAARDYARFAGVPLKAVSR